MIQNKKVNWSEGRECGGDAFVRGCMPAAVAVLDSKVKESLSEEGPLTPE